MVKQHGALWWQNQSIEQKKNEVIIIDLPIMVGFRNIFESSRRTFQLQMQYIFAMQANDNRYFHHM